MHGPLRYDDLQETEDKHNTRGAQNRASVIQHALWVFSCRPENTAKVHPGRPERGGPLSAEKKEKIGSDTSRSITGTLAQRVFADR